VAREPLHGTGDGDGNGDGNGGGGGDAKAGEAQRRLDRFCVMMLKRAEGKPFWVPVRDLVCKMLTQQITADSFMVQTNLKVRPVPCVPAGLQSCVPCVPAGLCVRAAWGLVWAGQGRAGQGRAGQGRAGVGVVRAMPGRAAAGCACGACGG